MGRLGAQGFEVGVSEALLTKLVTPGSTPFTGRSPSKRAIQKVENPLAGPGPASSCRAIPKNAVGGRQRPDPDPVTSLVSIYVLQRQPSGWRCHIDIRTKKRQSEDCREVLFDATWRGLSGSQGQTRFRVHHQG